MRRSAALLVSVALAAAACEAGEQASPRPEGEARTPASGVDPRIERSAAIYSAVIERLVTKDHTFGGGQSPFKHVYVLDGAVPKAGNVLQSLSSEPKEPFPDELKSAIEAELQDLPPLQFVPERKAALEGTRGLGVVVTLGRVAPSGNRVEVANNMWCGPLCGQWLTYVVKLQHGRWRVTGTVGPYAIS